MTQTPKKSGRNDTAKSLRSLVDRSRAGHEGRIGGFRIMVVNEPRSYREAITAAFKALRPEMEIFEAKPEDIDGEFLRRVPHLVVCSRLTEMISREAPAWIELYPGGSSYAVATLEGEATTYHDADLATLLSVLDGAHHLHGLS